MKKYLPIFIILVFIITFVYIYFFTNIISGKLRQEKPVYNIQIIDTNSIYTDEILSTKQEALLYVEQNIKENFTYYLVTGSFSEKTNAVNYKNSMNTKGFNAEVIRSDFYHYKVSIYSSTDKNEALDSLNKIKKINEFESAWLLKRKRE